MAIYNITISDMINITDIATSKIIQFPFFYFVVLIISFTASFTIFLGSSYDFLKHVLKIDKITNPKRLLYIMISTLVLSIVIFLIGCNKFGRTFFVNI